MNGSESVRLDDNGSEWFAWRYEVDACDEAAASLNEAVRRKAAEDR